MLVFMCRITRLNNDDNVIYIIRMQLFHAPFFSNASPSKRTNIPDYSPTMYLPQTCPVQDNVGVVENPPK